MQQCDGDLPIRRRSTLPALAPRNPQHQAIRTRALGSTAPRKTPRLSHRSRAGCWTCRGRKVKCDETQPVCGPCARLNRECDWEHRWNFSDSTSSTQVKNSNVSTKGSVVWDPEARASSSDPQSSSASPDDDLPEFANLTNDGDRERKATTSRPGTYAVIVTPTSFEDLPEYTSSEPGLGNERWSRRSSRTTSTSADSPWTERDPNTIVLDRFEDVVPGPAGPSLLEPRLRERPSLPNVMQHVSLASSPATPVFLSPTSPQHSRTAMPLVEARFRMVFRFRTYIMQRLELHRTGFSASPSTSPGAPSNIYESEAVRFPPLHHAICAISALNLSTTGKSTLEVAIQHYQQALDAQASASSSDMLLSDGVFLRHYLLFIYDICMGGADDGPAMWVKHLRSLRTLAQSRFQQHGRERFPHVLASICRLDVEASLMGNGNCEFIRAILENNMLPSPPADLESPTIPFGVSRPPKEAYTLQVISSLDRGILMHAAVIAQATQRFRADAAQQSRSPRQGFTAHWQATAQQLQHNLLTYWTEAYPNFLERDSPHAGQGLASSVKGTFEHALLLFHALVLYLRTSLPQPPIPPLSPTARHIAFILILMPTLPLHDRSTILPLYIAGLASTSSSDRRRVMDLLGQREGYGIGRNCSVVKRLLEGIWEERERRAAGQTWDWVEWGRGRGLRVVNCGL